LLSPQANGTVRFYHRKHQCYIVGEGSFIGEYGDLPDVSDKNYDSMADSIQSSTMGRRRSSAPLLPHGQKTFEVCADMGTIAEDATSCSIAMPLIFDAESQEQSISFSTDGSASLSDASSKFHTWSKKHPLRKQSTIRDDVISEDGKTTDTSACMNMYLTISSILYSVHFRRKITGLSSQSYSSPNAFWQIEKFTQPCSGKLQLGMECYTKLTLPS
jgi:hypothetical protein